MRDKSRLKEEENHKRFWKEILQVGSKEYEKENKQKELTKE